MKNTLRIILIFLPVWSGNMLYAQDQLKIGHVNTEEIVAAMPESVEARIALESDTDELEKMLENMQVEYNKLLSVYQENLNTYSPVIRQAKETELIELQNRIQVFQQEALQQLQDRKLELMQPIYTRIQDAISEVATRQGFTYILDVSKGSVVFTSVKSQNINMLVLKELGVTP